MTRIPASKTRAFALIGAAGFIAPRHLKAIKETSEDKIPEKAAAANAFKITLAMLTKKEEADAE